MTSLYKYSGTRTNVVKNLWVRVMLLSLICILFSGRSWAMSAEFSACVIKNMRGQDKSVMSFAVTLCESRFPFRKTIYLSGGSGLADMSWSRAVDSNDNTLGVVFTKNRSRYSLDSIKLGFGKKKDKYGNCRSIDKVKIIDFKIGGRGWAWAQEKDIFKDAFECVKIYEVWGRRKSGE